MRKLFSKSLSVILAASLAFTSVNITSVAKETSDEDAEILVNDEEQEQELKETLRTAVSDENHPGGVFGFYQTILNAKEGDELAVSVVRQGNTDEEASVLFKAVDVSAEYKQDYTLSVEKGLFGDKDLPAADGVRPLMEEYGEIATEEDIEAAMETEMPQEDAALEEEEAYAELTEEELSIEEDMELQEAEPEDDEIEISSEEEDAEISLEENTENSEAAPQYIGGSSSLADIYSLQTGEDAPEHDWTEYTAEEVDQETANTMREGWEESRASLESLEGVSVRLTFAPGEYKKDIKIKVKDDSKSESDEVVLFVLQDAENAEIGDSYNGYLNISDNDSHEELVYSVVEKNIIVTPDQDTATVTVRRNSGIDQMDFVSVVTKGIDAVPDVDYIALNEELFFPAGITERTVEVPVISERTKVSSFWVGVTSEYGTVTEDNACLVTIQQITDEDITPVENAEYQEVSAEDAEYSEDDAELTEVSNLGADKAPIYSVTVYEQNNDNYRWGAARGDDAYKYFPKNIDISSADYVRIDYECYGCTKGALYPLINADREKVVTIWLQDENGKDIKTPSAKWYQPPAAHPDSTTAGYAEFNRLPNENWNYKNAKIRFGLVGKTGTRNEDVGMNIKKITVGYTQYKLQMIPEFDHMDQYQEKKYTTIISFENGSKVTYPKVYLTNGNNNYTEVTALSGAVFGVSKEAKGDTTNSLGVFASEETVEFKGFKLKKPGANRDLSPLTDAKEIRLDNNFKIKFKDYIYPDGTIQLVPVFEPKKVTIDFSNENAKISGREDAKGCYDGITSGGVLTATMLDTLKITSKANEGYGVTGMALQRKYGYNDSSRRWGRDYNNIVYKYAEVANNRKTDNPNLLVVPLNYGVKETGMTADGIINLSYTSLSVVINYDNASITVAPSPQSKNNAKNGSILYVEESITENNKDSGQVVQGGQKIKIEGTSINKGYTFGSIPADGYHTFWKDGTLDYDDDGIVNDVNPFYKSFQNSYGNSFRYTTQLPISKIYYNFVKGVDMKEEEEPVPIRGWLIIRDKLLISGTQVEQGINNVNVFCDGAETRTRNGGFGGRSGEGYFELNSDHFFDLFTYAVTFTGSCDYGDVATMSVQNPGTNKDILVETWKDVNISDVLLFQSVKKQNDTYEYEKIDTSAAKSGYFCGLSEGDYNYRIQMTAHRNGVNITRGEMTFYNKDGTTVTIDGTQDKNNAGIFTFDFNPKSKSIKPGATAKVTFYAGSTRFLSRDVGIRLRAGLGEMEIANFLAGGDAGVVIDIIGAVNTALDMGWKGNADKVSGKSDVYEDEDQNKVIKVGISGNVITKKSKDKYNEATKDAAKKAKEVGKLNSKIAKLEGQIENATGENKTTLQGELASAKMDLEKAQKENKEAKEKLDETLEGMTKPKKNKPKFGTKFTMDLGFSFLLTFGYDNDVEKHYFKNMMLTATLGAAFEVTMNYATPIGITIGIGLKLELNGSASFVVEQRAGFEDNKKYRYYVTSEDKKGLNVLDSDGDDPNRSLDKYGLFSVNPAITLTLSAGVAGDLLKVAVSGKASLTMVFGTSRDSAGSCTLSASIKITALIFSFTKELANKTYKLWGDDGNVSSLGDVYSRQIMQAISDAGDSYLYESIDEFEAEDVSYLAEGTDWYGGAEDSDSEFNAIDEGGEAAYNESLLADKIGANPEFNMVSLGEGRFAAVYLNVPVNRVKDSDNAKAAYYTYFDGSLWSDPIILEEDYTLDQYPRIYSLGSKGAFIVWSTVSEDYRDTEDKLERQNALDIHGMFVEPDGTISENVEEITKTTVDPKAEATGIDISDFAADRAFGVFSNEDKLVVCYEKRQYSKGSDDTAQVGDMMYPSSTIVASRTYDFATKKWAEGTESLESLPGLAALRADVANERLATYNANVYGQKFFDYLPKVLLIEDVEEPSGYYREGGSKTMAVKLGESDKGFLLDSDATCIKSGDKELGVVAYTVDTDGDLLNTTTDKELYLATYDMATGSFSEPIILTGYEVNADTGASYLPESSCPRFVSTDSGLFLTWIRNENILALNVSNILDNEDVLVKTGTVDEVSYRYIDKAAPDDSAKVSYHPPYSLVSGRISSESEDKNVTGDIHEFAAESDGKYIYVLWPESADDRPEETENGLIDIQMWCARSEAIKDEGEVKIIDITKPVQITSAYENNYDDVAFGVKDGKVYGLARKIPSRFITIEEAKEIHTEDFAEETFVPYAIWDDKEAYPISFFVDPSSVARIRNAGFSDAEAGEGANFSFDILNDGFDTLDGATVSAKDSEGNELLNEEDRKIDGLIGGDTASIAGFLPLDQSAKEAKVTITVTEKSGEVTAFIIHEELKQNLSVYNLAVKSTDERGLYRVTGVVENNGNATSEAGTLKLFTKANETQRVAGRVSYPALEPGDSYDIDTLINVTDEDFVVHVDYVDSKTGEIVAEPDIETASAMITETLNLYASYDVEDETIELPVYEEDWDEESEEFIKRIAYAQEMEYVEAVKGITVEAVKAVTDEKGTVTGETVSIGKGLISLEAGEEVSLLTAIESSKAGRSAAVDDEGDVLFTSTGTENLTYRYEFSGDVGEFAEDGTFVATKPGSGKLTVYVYPADREYSADNYIRMPGDELDTKFAFSQMDEGDYVNTFDDFPAAAIKTYVLDVEVLPEGERVEDADTSIFEDKGIYYRKSANAEVAVCGINKEKKITSITIPATVKKDGVTYKVTRIDANTFHDCDDLISVTIGKNVTTIRSEAFAECNSLAKVKFGANVQEIGDEAFKGCTALKDLKLPSKLEKIGAQAFMNCISITSVTLPSKVSYVGDKAFFGCVGLKKVTINTEVLTTDNFGADVFGGVADNIEFKFNIKNEDVKKAISDLLTDEAEVFRDKKGITYKVISEENRILAVTGLTDEAKAKQKTLTIPKSINYKGYKYSVVNVEKEAFAGNTLLTKVNLPKTLQYIKEGAFRDATALKSIVIPASVSKIGTAAFSGCTALTRVTIAGEAVEIGEDAFAQVPDKAKFNITTKNKAAKDEIIRNLLLYIDTFTDAGNNVYLLNTDETFEAYLTGTNDAAAKSIKVPDAVTYRGLAIPVIGIQESAFKGNTAITTVTVGKNVRTIDNQAFEGCTSLSKVTMKSAGYIEDSAFEGCTSLKNLKIANNNEFIGPSAFKGCSALKSVIIPAKVRTIDDEAFEGCSALKTVTIKSQNLILVGYKAFDNNSAAATYRISNKKKLEAYKKLLTDAGVDAGKIK